MTTANIYDASATTTRNFLRGILNAVEEGLADAGMPLTDEQSAFLATASEGAAA